MEINKETLPHLLNKYIEEDLNCFSDLYYKCISSEKTKSFNESLPGLGEVALYVLKDKDAPKKVAMFRQTGMLIKEKGHFRTPIRFVGVFEARGDELNERLRDLEPPGHDDWQPSRFSEKREEIDQAEKLIRTIYSWINEKVQETLQAEKSDDVDAAGIGRFLPDDFDEDQPFEQDLSEGNPEDNEIEEIQVPKPKRETVRPTTGEDAGSEGGLDGTQEGYGRGENDSSGGEPPTDVASGGTEEDGGSQPGFGGKKAFQRRSIPLATRAFCVNGGEGKYRLVVIPEKSGSANIRLTYVGEEGWEQGSAPIKSAKIVGSESELSIDTGGAISSMPLEQGARYVIEITLKESMRCAIGVDADEN